MKNVLVFVVVVLMFSFLGRAVKADSEIPAGSAYDFSFSSIDGEALPLSQYQGKVLLVVNTASQCGFTKQYEGLQALYERYKDRGLVILGVPSNDFGGQEPGTATEIKHFCTGVYKITFPLADKTVVSGKDAHPFYQWAAAAHKGNLVSYKPRWNFHKYLVGPDGALVASYGSTTTPDDAGLVKAIEGLLSQ